MQVNFKLWYRQIWVIFQNNDDNIHNSKAQEILDGQTDKMSYRADVKIGGGGGVRKK